MDPQVQERIEQYELAVAFAREFIEEFGQERALEIISRAFEKKQIKAGQELAEQLGSNTVEAMAQHCRQLASERDSMEVLEVTEKGVALKISRCSSWEAFEELGAPEVCKCYCDSDDAYIKAFNPEMKLIRTKTLADGDSHCDHIWALED